MRKWLLLVLCVVLSGCLLEQIAPGYTRITVSWQEIEQAMNRYGVQYAELSAQFDRATTDEQRARINARIDALNNASMGMLRTALDRPGKIEIVVTDENVGAALSATTRPSGVAK